ncbi:MAG: extracellular solute-binding protein [Clostridia bacterium]|nr:extracellular solute-binding protein [Clostridia bacterium]
MKKTRQILCAALAAMMTLSIASCGTTETSGGNKIEKITVWSNAAGTKDVLEKLVQEYNENEGKEKGIMIEYTVHGGDYAQTLDMAFANDRAPDMMNIQGERRNYVDKGYLMPIDDLPGMDEFLAKYDEETLTRFAVDGRIYSVPTQVTAVGLIYNKDLFKKAGIVDENGEAKPPRTWAEMVDAAKKITDVPNKVYGIALPMKWGGYWSWDFQKPMFSATGKYTYDHANDVYDYSLYKEPLEYLLQIKEDKSFYPGPEGLDNDPARAQFAEGFVGMKFAASWDVSVLTNQFPAKCDWGVAPVPAINEEAIGKYYYESADECALDVSSKAREKDPEKISEVYRFFNSDEVLTRLYEEGCIIPYRSECITNATKISDAKGWVEFGEIATKSKAVQGWVSLKLEGESDKDALNKVWYGTMTVDEFIADRNKIWNDAYQKALAEGTVERLEEYKALPAELFNREIH